MAGSVLVPLDGSPQAAHALAWVAPYARAYGRTLRLVAVAEPAAPADPLEPGADDAGPELLGLALAAEQLRLAAAGHEVRTTLRRGDPAGELLAEVEADPPDLVALTSHGRGGLRRWLRGAVAARLLRRCPVPLLVCRPEPPPPGPGGPFRRLLVPLDGSERAAGVLPLAQDLARAYGAAVVLLRVARRRDAGLAADAPPLDARALEGSLAGALAFVRAAGVEAEARGRLGDPAAEIVDAVADEGADLVVLSTHGRTGLARWVFGSVAEHVLHQVAVPVLVARPALG